MEEEELLADMAACIAFAEEFVDIVPGEEELSKLGEYSIAELAEVFAAQEEERMAEAAVDKAVDCLAVADSFRVDYFDCYFCYSYCFCFLSYFRDGVGHEKEADMLD